MRVLFVCTANVCRSRMAEDVFRSLVDGPFGHEVRSAGTVAAPGSRQLIEADLDWADVVCVMEASHQRFIAGRWSRAAGKVRILGIPDVYAPGDPVLRDLLATHILLMLADRDRAGRTASRG